MSTTQHDSTHSCSDRGRFHGMSLPSIFFPSFYLEGVFTECVYHPSFPLVRVFTECLYHLSFSLRSISRAFLLNVFTIHLFPLVLSRGRFLGMCLSYLFPSFYLEGVFTECLYHLSFSPRSISRAFSRNVFTIYLFPLVLSRGRFH